MSTRARCRMAIQVLAAALGGAVLLWGAPAAGHSTGETGHSGKQRATCNVCHSGGTAPGVSFLGPSVVVVGDTVTYRFEVQSMRASQVAAGFNVADTGGVLAVLPNQGEQLIAHELTHTTPKPNTDMVADWDFAWTAPAMPGTAELFGAGNSVNLNGQTSGDRASTTTFAILVVDVPTPTPTATPLPPDPTATDTAPPTRTATATTARTATPTDPPGTTPTAGAKICIGDCDGSDAVGINELVVGVNVALGNALIQSCPLIDANGDGRVEINELIAAVANALDGCR